MGIYMIRSNDKNTVLCYSPLPGSEFTSTAMDAHAWFLRTGRDTYWEDIFKQSKDSTFTLLPILWYLLYAWAEALESLYLYLNKLVSVVFLIVRFRSHFLLIRKDEYWKQQI